MHSYTSSETREYNCNTSVKGKTWVRDKVTDKQIDKQTDKKTERRIHSQTDKQNNGVW